MNEEHKLIGLTGAETGFETPDPKDSHQGQYTTTPANSQVSSSDHMEYAGIDLPDPKEVTGQFDHLATRDPASMDQALQTTPEFAGAQTVGDVNTRALDLATPVAGLDVSASMLAGQEARLEAVDPNRNYTPPSEKVTPHVREQPGDLPPGETAELRNAVEGHGKRPD